MTWVYDVRKNTFERDGAFQFFGMYAGAPGYKNNPDFECIKNKGPLPRGKYRIVGSPFKHKKAGFYTLQLEPFAENNMCGRSGFLIHGESSRYPGQASEGCIVVAPQYRKRIFESGDKVVIVI